MAGRNSAAAWLEGAGQGEPEYTGFVSAAAAAAAAPLPADRGAGQGEPEYTGFVSAAAAAAAAPLPADRGSAASSARAREIAAAAQEKIRQSGVVGDGDFIGNGALFSGTVVMSPPLGASVVECDEALALFGSRSINVPVDHMPAWVQAGSSVCFKLRSSSTSSEPELVAGSVQRPAEIPEQGPFVGTLQTISQRQERVGWLTSLATQQRLGTDVYAHGSLIEGFGIGDAIRFEVHVNVKGQPQACRGTIQRLGVAVEGIRGTTGKGSGKQSRLPNFGLAMDATSYAPGRVVPLAMDDDDVDAEADEDDLCEDEQEETS
eukprot:TRINITY_DN15263_c0_g2_i1.p1 TRINITY_DN15263_c0_g2~~TRINITY_DN15263_c0_g2_i1.p1  ORF type:complete len:339 (-),score=91.44 TRINITY_DN15263_c0_g2_i1:26-982(-)